MSSALVKKRIYLFIGLSLLAVSCAKDLVTGKKTYNWFSIQDDIKMGDQVMTAQLTSLKKKSTQIDDAADPVMTKRIETVVERIGKVSHYPNFPYEVHYSDVDIVNAWCAPGGKVMVYEGLFDEKKGLVNRKSDDEIAAVLGHEIAHATARHVSESLSRNYTIATVGTVALSAISASGAGAVQDAFGRVIVEGINLYIPYYSRSNESEADRIGIMYMAKAGYNPQSAVDLWYRACKKRGDIYSLYASHPTSCERAKNLEKLLPEAQVAYESTKPKSSNRRR